jgi:hypothetical protein
MVVTCGNNARKPVASFSAFLTPSCHQRRGESRQKPPSPPLMDDARMSLFIKAVNHAEPKIRLFCLVLGWSGGRNSEVLARTPTAINIHSGDANIETLKPRKPGVVPPVPLPRDTLHELNQIGRQSEKELIDDELEKRQRFFRLRPSNESCPVPGRDGAWLFHPPDVWRQQSPRLRSSEREVSLSTGTPYSEPINSKHPRLLLSCRAHPICRSLSIQKFAFQTVRRLAATTAYIGRGSQGTCRKQRKPPDHHPSFPER